MNPNRNTIQKKKKNTHHSCMLHCIDLARYFIYIKFYLETTWNSVYN